MTVWRLAFADKSVSSGGERGLPGTQLAAEDDDAPGWAGQAQFGQGRAEPGGKWQPTGA